MEDTWIFCCEDSVEGIFTAIYEAWDSRHGHDNNKIELLGQSGGSSYELFARYINVETDIEKAEKVINSIPKKISHEVRDMVMKATMTDCEDKADVIYHFLVRGYAVGKKVVDYLSDRYVMRVFEMNRSVGNEAHHYKGFLRFEELVGDTMVARFEPKNDIAIMLAPHYLDRFPDSNYMILDVKRRHAAVSEAHGGFYMVSFTSEQIEGLLHMTDKEDEIKQCFRTFFKSIGIKERENYRYQRNNVPIHFRKYMIEFH